MKKMTSRRPVRTQTNILTAFAPLSLAALVAVGGVATSYYATREDPVQPFSSIQGVTDTKTPLPNDLSSLVPPTKIQEIAQRMGGSSVTEIALENRNGRLIYSTELHDGKKLGFDATTGSAVSVATEADGDSRHSEKKTTQDPGTSLNSRIPLEDAAELSQAAFPQNKITEIKLKPRDGKPAILVLFDNAAMIEVDAETGEVTRVATPQGAVAEVPRPSAEPSAQAPSQDSTNQVETQSATEENTQVTESNGNDEGNDGSPPESQSETSKNIDKTTVEIEGLLMSADGVFTITESDTTYRIETEVNMKRFIGERVRVKGRLNEEGTIQATKVEPVRDFTDTRDD